MEMKGISDTGLEGVPEIEAKEKWPVSIILDASWAENPEPPGVTEGKPVRVTSCVTVSTTVAVTVDTVGWTQISVGEAERVRDKV
jgi:hypothetical protein